MNATLQKLIEILPWDSCAVIYGNTEIIRNGDVFYPFRQSSDFLYLTELDAPDLIVSIFQWEVIIWREPISDKDILWWHNKLNDQDIIQISGINDMRNRDLFDDYYSLHRESIIDPTIVTQKIHELRLIKTPQEIEKMQKAMRTTKTAFDYIASILQPGMYEYEIEAEIARIFRKNQMTEAYPSIVASGPNSCILHYTQSSRQMHRFDILLVDAGAEYRWYASDMTRTFVVGWEFSQRQQEVYDSVERVKKFSENILKPGILFSEYESQVRAHMNTELIKLGLIPTDSNQEDIILLSKKYFPHRVSHFLGLDVHDVGPRDIVLRAGMVVTIEPGIYIPEESIGIRIEDDYVLSDSGCIRLS